MARVWRKSRQPRFHMFRAPCGPCENEPSPQRRFVFYFIVDTDRRANKISTVPPGEAAHFI
jgi:hypothetical protein